MAKQTITVYEGLLPEGGMPQKRVKRQKRRAPSKVSPTQAANKNRMKDAAKVCAAPSAKRPENKNGQVEFKGQRHPYRACVRAWFEQHKK